jgi:hypothetical protein
MSAQQKLDGEYRLIGVHDMASAFHFTPDGTFRYFSMYGAIDRQAEGTYTVNGNTLLLKSNKPVGQDFPLVSQSKKGKGYTIKVIEPNAYLRKYVLAIYKENGQPIGIPADDDGVIHIDADNVDTIQLVHDLFIDEPCLLKDASNTNNTFEVKLGPTLAQASFINIEFMIDGDTITCPPNYLMPFEHVRFVKE